MKDHVEELAELYALGALSDTERARIDEHLAMCAACSERVGQSEAIVASLTDATIPARTAPPELAQRLAQSASVGASEAWAQAWRGARVFFGVAAAIVLALGLSLILVTRANHDLAAAQRQDELAFAAMTHSHFAHAEFLKLTPASPAAKVIYARDGRWFYVVVDARRPSMSVTGEVNGKQHDFGMATTHAQTTTLYAEPGEKVQRLELREGASIVGVATPQY